MNLSVDDFSFRRATKMDVPALRILARDSEAIWGFDNAFLQTYDASYNVTEGFVVNDIVYVMEHNDTLVGFWGIVLQDEGAELAYFYVDAKMTRMGFGKRLWIHMSDWCRAYHIRRIEFVTSDPAVGFYLKCGAHQNGTDRSTIDGRVIPKLYCEFRRDNMKVNITPFTID